jgi:hypothetical protein
MDIKTVSRRIGGNALPRSNRNIPRMGQIDGMSNTVDFMPPQSSIGDIPLVELSGRTSKSYFTPQTKYSNGNGETILGAFINRIGTRARAIMNRGRAIPEPPDIPPVRESRHGTHLRGSHRPAMGMTSRELLTGKPRDGTIQVSIGQDERISKFDKRRKGTMAMPFGQRFFGQRGGFFRQAAKFFGLSDAEIESRLTALEERVTGVQERILGW